MNDFQDICKCTHAKTLHEGLRRHDSHDIPSYRDTSCQSNTCDCSEYEFSKRICIKCKGEAHSNGKIAKVVTEENPEGGVTETEEYCMTEGCDNFKYS